MAARHTHTKVAALAATLLILTGCAPAIGYADLTTEPTPEDAAPADLPDYAFDSMDASTLRFVDEVDGKRLYLATGAEAPVCILMYVDATNWSSSCGSEMMTISSGSFEVMLVTDGMPNRDGWTRSGNNLLVKDS